MFRSAPDVLRYLLGTVLLIGIAGCRSDAVGPSPGTDEEEDPAPGWEAPPDPGRMAWSRVPNDSVFEVCRLDPDLLNAVTLPSNGSFAIVRYGRLCHVSGVDGSHGPATGQLWSTTKTLGAVLTGAVMYSTRHLPETDEPGTGRFGEFDRMDSWIDLKAIPPTASINPDARVAHVLAMVGYSQDLEHGKKQHRYDTTGSREIANWCRSSTMFSLRVADYSEATRQMRRTPFLPDWGWNTLHGRHSDSAIPGPARFSTWLV